MYIYQNGGNMQDLSKEQKERLKSDSFLKIRAIADDITLFLGNPDESISILKKVIEEQLMRKSGEVSD